MHHLPWHLRAALERLGLNETAAFSNPSPTPYEELHVLAEVGARLITVGHVIHAGYELAGGGAVAALSVALAAGGLQCRHVSGAHLGDWAASVSAVSSAYQRTGTTCYRRDYDEEILIAGVRLSASKQNAHAYSPLGISPAAGCYLHGPRQSCPAGEILKFAADNVGGNAGPVLETAVVA